jgi:hypothetical protein
MKTFASTLLFLVAFSTMLLAQNYPPAQDSPSRTVDAGGKWTAHITEDKFTSKPFTRFELTGDESITGGQESGYPSFEIDCAFKDGKVRWVTSRLNSSVALGPPNMPSPLTGAPEQIVKLRANDKYYNHHWVMGPRAHSFFVDKDATKEILRSTNARVEFRDRANRPQVAIFSPAGLDRELLKKSCGNLVK